MPPAEVSMSTVALRVRIASACRFTLSMRPCCEDSCSGALEYCSSTGRLRNKHPVVGNNASNNSKLEKGDLRLIKVLRCLYGHLSIPEFKRFKTLVDLSVMRMITRGSRHMFLGNSGIWFDLRARTCAPSPPPRKPYHHR